MKTFAFARCPSNHEHPTLPKAILRQAFLKELQRFAAVAGIPSYSVGFPPSLSKTHESEPRRYAQVTPTTAAFEFASQILWLPKAHRVGLIAHEIGHVFTPGGSEDDADQAAAHLFGFTIEYDPRWHGKGLQKASSLD
jgi:hypothetical protein